MNPIGWFTRILQEWTDLDYDHEREKDPSRAATLLYASAELTKHRIRHWALHNSEIGILSGSLKKSAIHILTADIQNSEWVIIYQTTAGIYHKDAPLEEHEQSISLKDPNAIAKLCDNLPKNGLFTHYFHYIIVLTVVVGCTAYQAYCRFRGLKGLT